MDLQPLNDDERAELIAYLDGELDQTDALAVEKKLHTDPRVRAEADALRKTWNLLDYLPKAEPSTDFTNRTMTRVTAGPTTLSAWLFSRRARRRLGWAAALVLAGVIGYTAADWLPTGSRRGEQAELEQLARDLHALENMRLYQHVDDLPFLNELDRPDLFADDGGH